MSSIANTRDLREVCGDFVNIEGTIIAPLSFFLVAGVGFEPTTSGPRDGNRAQRLCLGHRKKI